MLLTRLAGARHARHVSSVAAAAAAAAAAAWSQKRVPPVMATTVRVSERVVRPQAAAAAAAAAPAAADAPVSVRTYRVVVRPEAALAVEYDSYGDETDLPGAWPGLSVRPASHVLTERARAGARGIS
jgi:hypothetical protein